MTAHSHIFETDDDDFERAAWRPRPTKTPKEHLAEIRQTLGTTEQREQ